MIELILVVIIIILLIFGYLQHQEVKHQQKIISELKTQPQTPLPPTTDHLEGTLFQAAESFNQSLIKTTQDIENQYLSSLEQSKKQHELFFVNLEKQTLTWQKDISAQMDTKVNKLLFDFEQNLANFLAKAESQSLESISTELRSARDLIESYKSQQFALVDENIVAVLERTMALVLKQKLSLKDHMDLVYEALGKAKLEKFLV